MNITRPAPKLQINLDLKHDAHIGDQVWVDQLPPLEEQTPDLLYIVYVSPEMRDRIMGLFIEFWDALESGLHHLFHTFSQTTHEVANTLISSYNGTKAISEAIAALGEKKLAPGELHKLEKLMERAQKIATKRNRIVHGHWLMILDYESVEGPHGVVLRPTKGAWERIYQPVSPSERESLAVRDQPKIAAKYRFDLDRIVKECETLSALVGDLSAFSSRLTLLLRGRQ